MTAYLTQHFDNARTGWNPAETKLTVSNVSQNFGVLFQLPVDAQVYAQPLVVPDVPVTGRSPLNLVFVATEANSVFAFDADRAGPWVWHRVLMDSGETPVPWGDVANNDINAANIIPVIGITATPAIDPVTQILYVVTKVKAGNGYHQRIHALDIATGRDRAGSPVEVTASFQGTGQGARDSQGHILFDPLRQLNRPGLLLAGGKLYVAFGSHGDTVDPATHAPYPYHGWVLSYDAATLKQLAVFNSTPDIDPVVERLAQGWGGQTGAIWQAGMGLTSDPEGNIYCVTGNGPFNADSGGRDYGDTVLKLNPQLHVVDYFTPCDQADLLAWDFDHGSGGVMLLPPVAARSPAKLLVHCAKWGVIYALNADKMGGYSGSGHWPACHDDVVWRSPYRIGPGQGGIPAILGGPAYFRDAGGRELVYLCAFGDRLKAYEVGPTGALSLLSSSLNKFTIGEGGAIPAVSSNGSTVGTAIVWLVARSNPLRLFAYDATNLVTKVFEGDAGAWPNAHGGAFMVPTVANGKVYVGSDGQVTVFGLLPCKTEMDAVTALQNEVDTLSEALANGEILKSHEAAARAQLVKLERQLLGVEKALSDCQARNP